MNGIWWCVAFVVVPVVAGGIWCDYVEKKLKMKRLLENIICYLIAAHIILWTAYHFLGRLIEEVAK